MIDIENIVRDVLSSNARISIVIIGPKNIVNNAIEPHLIAQVSSNN